MFCSLDGRFGIWYGEFAIWNDLDWNVLDLDLDFDQVCWMWYLPITSKQMVRRMKAKSEQNSLDKVFEP